VVDIVLPCHGRSYLTQCARWALRRTTSRPYTLWEVPNDDPLLEGEALDPKGGSYANGRKIDAVLAALPPDAEWLFTMHTDAAPLAPNALEWLLDQVRAHGATCGGFHRLDHDGLHVPHPLGALYSVPWLRDEKVSFLPSPGVDVGAAVPATGGCYFAGTTSARPWWLRSADIGTDEAGRILYGHLGGGTIGATAPRIPWWTWPVLVRRHLDTQGCPR
jgi:hypothetical protein